MYHYYYYLPLAKTNPACIVYVIILYWRILQNVLLQLLFLQIYFYGPDLIYKVDEKRPMS